MNRMKYVAAALLCFHVAASAQVLKCVDAAGKITYTNQDCLKKETRRAITEPSQKAGAWSLLSTSSTEEFWGEDNSLQVGRTPAGIGVASIVGKRVDRAQRTVNIEQWYVSIVDCDAKRGRIVTTAPDGNRYIRHHDFVFGIGTAQAINAQVICEGYALSKGQNVR